LNSFGLDLEKKNGQDIIQTYYHIQWPGNGSFRIGFISIYKEDLSNPFKRYDFGAGFFSRPYKPIVKSIWNKIGFWYVDNHGGKIIKQFWIGIPSWLPVLFFGSIPVVFRLISSKKNKLFARHAAAL
jgi:hypothetical protein